MNKFLCSLLVTLIAMQISITEAGKAEMKKEFMETAKQCKVEENATDIDLQELMTKRPASTKTGKCMRACFMEKAGLITNGEFNPDALGKVMEQMNASEKMMDEVAAIGEECKDIKDDDRCELAAKAGKCICDSAKKRGISEMA